jgi:carbamoyltransferase
MELIKNIFYPDVVNLLLKQKIITIFQGRSEAGPRALGNRSLIFDPRNENGKDIVNFIKKREPYRPFAGSILKECASEWFDMLGLEESPFMAFSFKCKEDKKNIIPSIVHIDGTCRIQTVTEEQNYHYYNLIKEFYKITGVPILLNTSFNLAGDAMVETIFDALYTLKESELQYLYLPELNSLIKK